MVLRVNVKDVFLVLALAGLIESYLFVLLFFLIALFRISLLTLGL